MACLLHNKWDVNLILETPHAQPDGQEERDGTAAAAIADAAQSNDEFDFEYCYTPLRAAYRGRLTKVVRLLLAVGAYPFDREVPKGQLQGFKGRPWALWDVAEEVKDLDTIE